MSERRPPRLTASPSASHIPAALGSAGVGGMEGAAFWVFRRGGGKLFVGSQTWLEAKGQWVSGRHRFKTLDHFWFWLSCIFDRIRSIWCKYLL